MTDDRKPLWEVSLGIYVQMAASYLKSLSWSEHDRAHYASNYGVDASALNGWINDHVQHQLDHALIDLETNGAPTDQARNELADAVRRLVDASRDHGVATDRVAKLVAWGWNNCD